jgi:hypothetical protein
MKDWLEIIGFALVLVAFLALVVWLILGGRKGPRSGWP